MEPHDSQRDLGRVEGELRALVQRIDRLEGALGEKLKALDTIAEDIQNTLAQARGGYAALAWMVGFVSAVSSVVTFVGTYFTLR